MGTDPHTRSKTTYDALLVVSFGGPEKEEDVIPFLENALRGRNVPRDRMPSVAEHYYHFGGRSPINGHSRALVRALEAKLREQGPPLRVYWGNRNWHPLLAETLRTMTADGIGRALAFITSAYSSYSSCRQYREDIEQARRGAGEEAPPVDKLRAFYNHPAFIEVWAGRIREALDEFPAKRREQARLIFTAHSIPLSMAEKCRYAEQLEETCRLIAERLGCGRKALVYQSRSGPPSQAWLGPDIRDYLRKLARGGELRRPRDVVIAPVGFVCDHMEVVYDLDIEVRRLCAALGFNMVRAATPGIHAEFVSMIRELILERIDPAVEKRALGQLGADHDVCPDECCLP